jgi:tetratricopeptide (TPR) repeat protein
LSTHFLHGWQISRGGAFYLREADRARAEKNFDKEIASLARYLSYVPSDEEIRARYGFALEARGGDRDHLPAFLVLERVLRERPGREDVRRTLARIAVTIGRFQDGIDHLNELSKSADKDGELEYLYGRCDEGKGEYRSAAEHFARAIELPPQLPDGYIRLAGLYRKRLDQPAAADGIIDRLVKEKASAEAYLARARYLRERSAREDYQDAIRPISAETQFALLFGAGQNPLQVLPYVSLKTYDSPLLRKAEADLAEARRVAPTNPSTREERELVVQVFLEAAELAQAQARLGAARTFAERGLELDPSQPRLYVFLARLEARQGPSSRGIACLRRGLETLPDHPELLYTLADLLLGDGKLTEANQALARLREKGIDPAPVEVMEARVHMANREWLLAIRSLERAQPGLNLLPELSRHTFFLLGQCYEEVGDADQQYTAYRRAGADDPNNPLWVEVNAGTGRALLTMGKYDNALEIFRRLMPRAPSARIMVAHLLIATNLARPRDQRRWEEVTQTLDEADRYSPRSVQLRLLRAQALYAQDKVGDAELLLTRGRDEEPEQVTYWVGLANLAEQRRDFQKVLEILDEAEQKLGDHAELRLARIVYWRKRGGKEAVRALGEQARGLDRFKPEERRLLLRGLAAAYAQVGAREESRLLLQTLLRERPYDLATKADLFDLAVSQGDEALMEKMVLEIRGLEGEAGTLWRYGQARLTIWHASKGKIDAETIQETRHLLTAVAARRPAWFRVPTCQAALEELGKNKGAVLSYLLRALNLGENNPEVARRALQLLYEAQRYDEASELLRKLPEQAAVLINQNAMVIDLSLRNGDYRQAQELAEKACADKPDDYRNHIWLAHVRWTLDPRSSEVEPALRRAVALADNVPDTWLPLIQFLARTGQKDRAETEVRIAERKLSPEKHAAALAQCYLAVGRLDAAKELYRERLKVTPKDVALLQGAAALALREGQMDEAARFLEGIEVQRSQAPAEADAARRLLWFLKSAGKDYQPPQELLASLGAGGPSGPAATDESPEDLRAKALLLAMRGRRPDRQQAVRLLVACGESQPLVPEDQLLLSQLYDSLGDWPKARAGLARLLETHQKNLLYLGYYAAGLIRHNDLDEAERCLSQMEKLPAELRRNAFSITEVRARLLSARHKGDEARKLLIEEARQHEDRTGAVAQLLEELKQLEAAELMYRKLVTLSKSPELMQLRLALFLGRQRRLGEALDLCEQGWGKLKPEVVSSATLLVLYAGAAEERDCERAVCSLEAALQKKPTSSGLLSDLAALRNLQGRFDAAEKLFAQVLRLDKRDALAMNNLAFLLAFRDGKAEEALLLIAQAVEIKGPLPVLLDTRGVVYLAMGRADLAVKDLKEAATERDDAATLFHLALAYDRDKKRVEAVAALKRAESLGLTEQRLHPLERPSYKSLKAALGGN